MSRKTRRVKSSSPFLTSCHGPTTCPITGYFKEYPASEGIDSIWESRDRWSFEMRTKTSRDCKAPSTFKTDYSKHNQTRRISQERTIRPLTWTRYGEQVILRVVRQFPKFTYNQIRAFTGLDKSNKVTFPLRVRIRIGKF
jgi:hypothetical protein